MTELKPKTKEFANEFIDTNNGTQAVQKVFGIEDPNYAGVKAHRLLRSAKVQEYIEDKAETAASVVYTIATTGETDTVKLAASKDILDRAGYKPIERSVSATVNLDANSTERTRELGAKLISILRR